MSKENFQIPENHPNKTKEIISNLVSLILPKQLSFDEQVKALEKSRLKIQNIVDSNNSKDSEEKLKIKEIDKIISEKMNEEKAA